MSDASSELPADPDHEAVQSTLTKWYEADHRGFPWRHTDDPYEILVSEAVSQQTQLGRVVEAWETFLDEWPTTVDPAAADRTDVIGSWTDHRLGYSNRVKYPHEAARQAEEDYGGRFPRTSDSLSELMGVSPYTANAVASLAFNDDDAVVDTSVERVLHRAFAVPDDDAVLKAAAPEPMPDGEPRIWNNAIMELGGVACGRMPACDEPDCPQRWLCHAYETGDFTAPDVPTQSGFEGSRRQFRGRVVRIPGEYDELGLSELGPRIRVDYGGDTGAEWLRGLVDDLKSDGLVDVAEGDDGVRISLVEQPALR